MGTGPRSAALKRGACAQDDSGKIKLSEGKRKFTFEISE
jgi:hypothetical protein